MNPKTSPSRRLWGALPWLILLLIGCLIVVLARGCVNKTAELDKRKAEMAKADQQPVTVVTQLVTPATMTDRINLPALIMPWEDVMVSSEVIGNVIALAVSEGDRVEKDQVIAEIDKRDYLIALATVQARQELAQANFKRVEKLADSNSVARAQYDEALASVKELNAALDTARLNLSRCSIRSPIAGVVNSLPARIGTLLSHGDPVAQVLTIDRLKVEIAIPESEVAATSAITECSLTIAALNNLMVTGRKIFLSSQPALPSMVYTLRLALDNPEARILPGMFGRADIVKHIKPQALGIPLYAVITEGRDKFVFVAEAGVARKRKVTTGFLEGWKVEILSGISPGEQVVIVGHRALDEGQPLNIAKSLAEPELPEQQ